MRAVVLVVVVEVVAVRARHVVTSGGAIGEVTVTGGIASEPTTCGFIIKPER